MNDAWRGFALGVIWASLAILASVLFTIAFEGIHEPRPGLARQADSQRLDWLSRTDIQIDRSDAGYKLMHADGRQWRESHGHTLRAAIDRGMDMGMGMDTDKGTGAMK